ARMGIFHVPVEPARRRAFPGRAQSGHTVRRGRHARGAHGECTKVVSRRRHCRGWGARMNMQEKRAVERAFPSSIFITFNGSLLRALFPEQLPVFYRYSLRRGTSVKPWFLPDEAVASVRACPA